MVYTYSHLISELVFELGVQPGHLENYSYPDAFPTPPNDLFSEVESDGASPGSLARTSIEKQRRKNEQGWCFYLAEISVRRTVDETLNLLYSRGPDYWMASPAYLIRQYHESDEQVSMWYAKLEPN
jgi:hypothetical protein